MKPLALCVLLLAFPAHAQMYKCVDERGVTHYSDKPRPGCKGGKVDIQAIPPVSGKPRTPAPAKAAPKRAAKVQLTEQEKAQLASRCKTLREEYDWLLSPRGAAAEAHAARVGQVRQAMLACP